MASFTAEERRRLAAALDRHADPAAEESATACPACGDRVDVREVRPPASVAYVRRRVWVLCPGCRRSGAVDLREGGRP